MDPRTKTLVELFEYITDRERVNRTVDEIYAQDAVFRDPVQKAEGREKIRRLLFKMGSFLDGVDTVILKDTASEDVLAIHWLMTFKLKRWPFPATIPGVTWMDLNEKGECIAQVDYWDLGTFLKQVLITGPVKKVFRR